MEKIKGIIKEELLKGSTPFEIIEKHNINSTLCFFILKMDEELQDLLNNMHSQQQKELNKMAEAVLMDLLNKHKNTRK